MIKKTQLVTAIGAVAGASFALSAAAADNPFQADELEIGTMNDQASFGGHGDDKEGKCGEDHEKDKDKEGEDKEGSCGEGSCGEGDDSEGSCGEGSCGAA
ncbi:MAG: low-complexity protein [Wenzhouxiangellaceae bacterium]|nr:low-complexity protein [Wenzhouxiangellaceae bacterium]